MKSKHRVIKEIPRMQHLEKQVAEAAAVVADWKNTIAKIETQLNIANQAVANAQKTREVHALGAAMNDAAAIGHVKHARAQQHSAEQTIADLRVALPKAEAELAAAKKAEATAQHNLARHEAGMLARERVTVASRIDALIADFSAALGEFEKLGNQIGNMPGLLPTDPLSPGMSISRMEEIQGNRRVRSALPKLWLRFFPGALHEERPAMKLEASEIAIWSSVAQLETTQAKAA